MRSILSITAFFLTVHTAPAAESLPPGAKVMKVTVWPAAVELDGPFASAQLLVTAHLEGGATADATRIAAVTVPKFVIATQSVLLRPHAEGAGDIIVTLSGHTARVPVRVSGLSATRPISFVNDVQPGLSKMGCNAGTCHGAQAGKNGFKLCLRGYDPIYDYRALTDDLEGRRFNRAAPERSLMLMKPAGGVPHAGGVTMQPGEPSYDLVKGWIEQGLPLDLAAPRVTGIEVFPKNPTVGSIGGKQQFAVVATYANGTKRDVTAVAFLDSSNTEVASVDKTGLSTTLRRGESTMLARYEGAYAASTVVVLGDRSGFTWTPRPIHNVYDQLVDEKLQAIKIQPSDLCDDATFVRRVHLDLTGLPPTAGKVRQFLADPRVTQLKRNDLIDELLVSPAAVDHWTNKWADLLQVNRKFLGEAGAKAFRDWIRQAVIENKPYDEFAKAILTASGSNVTNPPASYFKILRDARRRDGEHDAALPGDPLQLQQVPRPPVRALDAGPVLPDGRVLRAGRP